jgi:hypothetical protein
MPIYASSKKLDWEIIKNRPLFIVLGTSIDKNFVAMGEFYSFNFGIAKNGVFLWKGCHSFS